MRYCAAGMFVPDALALLGRAVTALLELGIAVHVVQRTVLFAECWLVRMVSAQYGPVRYLAHVALVDWV